MKLLYILALFVFYNATSQNTLSITLVNCKSIDIPDEHHGSTIILFKNDSIAGEEVGIYETDFGDAVISDLPDGRYYVAYPTVFGRLYSDDFILNEKNKDRLLELEFCIDVLERDAGENTDDLFIDKLKEGEGLTVEYSYSGCFTGGKEIFMIKKEKNKTYILYKEMKHKLKAKQLVLLKEFENELRRAVEPDYISTSVTKVKIAYNGETVSFTGPSGYWEGYDYLMKKLGLKE